MGFIANLDLGAIEDQLDMLHDQRGVGQQQPLNMPLSESDWVMFFFDELLFYWEGYDIAIKELTFIITPMISMVYINYLGTLQFFGMHVNGIFYICIVVAIGLLVDFLMHILLRYYESSPTKCRDERVKETLETMGASILLGGLTTFLGVVPLCLSSTKIFFTVFLAFFGMVLLGVIHGLILLPVILSLIGPTGGIACFEDGVTTFECSTRYNAEDRAKLMDEFREIEGQSFQKESAANGGPGALENEKSQPEEQAATVEPESNDDPPSEEEPPQKRETLTQVYV